MNNIYPINLIEKLSKIDKTWTPYIIGELNQQYIKIAKVQGDFVWHHHEHEDELFLVLKGTLYIELKNKPPLKISENQMVIIPKGEEHRPYTNGEIVEVLLFEPKSTLHTGTSQSELTNNNQTWI